MTELGEDSRLRSLRRSGLLEEHDTEAFDRITRVTRRLLGVETALISLVDHDRQRFAGQVGVRADLVEERGSSIKHSYCRIAVATGERLVVGDARESALLRESPAIAERDAIAYAGIPLRVGTDDEIFGTLCVIEPRPREWTEDELETLAEMAEIARTEINSRVQARRAELVEQLALRLPEPVARLGDSVRTTASLVEHPEDPRLPRTADVARNRYQVVETISDDLARAADANQEQATPRPTRLDLGERVARAVKVATATARPDDLRLDLPPFETPVFAIARDLDRALALVVVTALHHVASGAVVEVGLAVQGGDAVVTVTSPDVAVPVAETLRVVGSFQSGFDASSVDVAVRGGTTVVRGLTTEARMDASGTRFETRLQLIPALVEQRS